MNAVVRPFRACGTIAVPSSKSELHRLLIAAALADRPTDIACRALSDDVQATLRCLRALGAETECRDGLCRVSPVAERRALPAGAFSGRKWNSEPKEDTRSTRLPQSQIR